MKLPFFGRSPSSPQQTSQSQQPSGSNDSAAHPGHRALLDHLRRNEGAQPLIRPKLVGRLLFYMACKMIAKDNHIRMEDLLAILASIGGFTCLLAALSEAPIPRPDNGLMTLGGKDGYRYFFGDLPNRYLIESEFALLSLALGAAKACGGKVSLDMVHNTMRHVASTVGSASFGRPQLPAEHRPSDLPFNYVRFLWPKFFEGLMLYEVPPAQQPAALGFALQHAIMTGKDAIDPALAGLVAIECAVPMAKVDPERIVARNRSGD